VLPLGIVDQLVAEQRPFLHQSEHLVPPIGSSFSRFFVPL
jgi:hypothetical protein